MFKNNIVLVTGAASGIGFETARQFIEHGATVVGADYDEKTLRDASEKLGDRFIPKRCDVTVEEEIASLSGYVKDSFGKLDVLVNNAGGAKFAAPEEMREEDFYYHYDLLVKGPMLFVKHFVPLLRRSSNPSIVNISSLAARQVHSNHFLYSTAKAAIEKLTFHLVRDLPGIRSNTILPGFIDTPIYKKSGFTDEQKYELLERVKLKIPCGRIGKPQDISNCIIFLCSEKASYINGVSIPIDGGYLHAPDWGV